MILKNSSDYFLLTGWLLLWSMYGTTYFYFELGGKYNSTYNPAVRLNDDCHGCHCLDTARINKMDKI